MKHAVASCLTVATLLSSACSANKATTETRQTAPATIPFTEARNYFVKNNYPDSGLHTLKLTTKAEFDNVFGMAATMGENGQPTPIDFSQQYALAVIAATTSNATTFTPAALLKEGSSIRLAYRLTEGAEQSYSIRPNMLLIVPNQYQGDVKLQRQ